MLINIRGITEQNELLGNIGFQIENTNEVAYKTIPMDGIPNHLNVAMEHSYDSLHSISSDKVVSSSTHFVEHHFDSILDKVTDFLDFVVHNFL